MRCLPVFYCLTETKIAFVLKIWNWYFGKQENASKTFWFTFHLFLVLLQNQLWQNIPVTLLQLCQMPNPSAPEAPLSGEFWIKSLQFLFYSTYPREVNRSSSLSHIFRQQCHFPRSSQREDIYFFSILLDRTRCPDSTEALNCRMLVFQISFFPVCRIYFSITHSITHPFFCSEALNLYSHNICTVKIAFLFQSCLNSLNSVSGESIVGSQCK